MTLARPVGSRVPGLLAILLGVLVASLAALASPAPTSAASEFWLDLAGQTDFVAQTNFVQCVGASMQMMLNMIEPANDRTARMQLRLQKLARSLSGTRPDGRERQGASVRGWSAGLNQLGAGPYRIVGSTTIDEAMRLAAKSIRETGKPVGLLMWRGRHAWVMSGFRATGDPHAVAGTRVTHAIVMDPLYPHGSRTWGPSPKPRSSLTIAELGKQFVPRRTGSLAQSWLAGFGGKYVIVMAFTPVPSARSGVVVPA